MSRASRAMLLVLAAVVAAAAFWWGQRHRARIVSTAPPPAALAPPPDAAEAPPPAAPAVRHPIPSIAGRERALPALDNADGYVDKALVDLLGRKPVRDLLHVDGFVRRFVATVDNLATDNAAATMWPVRATPGRFEAERQGATTAVAGANADRYSAFVRLATSVDTPRAVGLYVRLYPLFQRAYEDLGYPGKYFNDRVVEVIDDLLATPDVPGAIEVKRVEVDGGGPTGGAGLYTFADPTLESRSAGQKIMLRIGRDNAAKLRAKLVEARRAIVADRLTERP